jgi:hypothetical protein
MAPFIQLVQNKFKFSLFLFMKLPAAWLAGVRVASFGPDHCVTVVPFRWLSQNPFRSTYFACLAMAAEMSTGLLAMMHVQESGKSISMLVTGTQATFGKKAIGKTWFTCNDGDIIKSAIAQTAATGEPVTLVVQSTGKNADGTEIAHFTFTWSFKRKA